MSAALIGAGAGAFLVAIGFAMVERERAAVVATAAAFLLMLAAVATFFVRVLAG